MPSASSVCRGVEVRGRRGRSWPITGCTMFGGTQSSINQVAYGMPQIVIAQSAGLSTGDLGDGDLFGRVSDTVSLDVLVGPASGSLSTVLRHRPEQSCRDQRPPPRARNRVRRCAGDPVGEQQVGSP